MFNFIRKHIGVKIFLGYMATIILMLSFSFYSINALKQISSSVTEVNQHLEGEKAFAQDIVTNLAFTRMYANKYVKDPSQENLDNYYVYFNKLEDMFAITNNRIASPARQEEFNEIHSDIEQYGSTFSEIAHLTQENQQIISQVLNIQELVIANKLTALRVYINSRDNPTLFLLYSNTQDAFQSMHLNVQNYIWQDDERYTILTGSNYQNAKEAFSNLQMKLQDPVQIQHSVEAYQALDEYYNGFLSIQDNQSQMRNLFNENLDVLDPKISDAVNNVNESIRQEYDDRNLATRQLIAQISSYIGWVITTMLVFSLVFSAIFSIGITKPLRQVMFASQQIADTDLTMLTTQMSTLSQGDIRLGLEVTTKPIKVTLHDEVGQMARVFNEVIFRLQDTRVAFEKMAEYLNEMTRSAREIAKGNLNTSITAHSEQDVLGKALVEMVKNLRTTQEELYNQLSRMEILHNIDGMIATNQDLVTTLSYILEQAIQHLGLAAGEIYLADNRTKQLRPITIMGFPESLSSDKFQEMFTICASKAIEQKEMIIISPIPADIVGDTFPFNACCSVPLIIQGEPRGVLQVFSNNDHTLTRDCHNLLETLAGQASIAIDNHELLRELEERVEQRTHELQQSQKYYQSLVSHSPVAIVVTDLEDKITGWNPAAEILFGYAPDEVIGRNLDEIVANEEYYQEATGLSEKSKQEFVHILSNRFRKDGTPVAVEIFGEPVIVEGKLLGSLTIYHDITDLQQARQIAEDATRTKSEFLANMSHEIRTPMNGVMGMTSLLLDTNLSKKQRDFVETIRISSESLLTIVNDILDFSKIEAGRMELETHPFNLRECVESALDLVAHQASSKGIELAYLMSPLVPEHVFGDETRLRQILTNLLSNAVKFTEKGEVVVTIVPCNLPESGDEKQEQCTLHFSVRDTGIGIPPNRMDRLFQSFSQVDASTTRKYGGTGLGLTICKKLVEMMDGNIWVESEGIPGKGSVFHFTVKITEGKELLRLDYNSYQNILADKHVWIVDDNQINCDILLSITAKWGMKPVAFKSGKDFLEEFDHCTEVNLAILDIQMPEMDGVMLAQEIRKRRDPEHLPIIFLTSLGRIEELTPEVKPIAFLHKPIKSSQLYNAMAIAFSETPVHIDPSPAGSIFDNSMADRHPLRILLAEDHVVNQKVALLTLERLGYRADVVSNGLEVMQAFNRQFYDVILMDAQMPEMDGIEATRQLRTILPADQQPWIIALTANALAGDRERYLESGMDDYLSKPVHIDHLVKALEKCKSQPTPETTSEENEPDIKIAAKAEDNFALNEENLEQLTPPIDINTLESYFPGFDQDITVLTDVVEMFLDDTPKRLQKLQSSINNLDIETTRITAHALKGASLTFGANHLSELSKELEMITRSGNLNGASNILDRIETEYQRVQISLRDLIEI